MLRMARKPQLIHSSGHLVYHLSLFFPENAAHYPGSRNHFGCVCTKTWRRSQLAAERLVSLLPRPEVLLVIRFFSPCLLIFP